MLQTSSVAENLGLQQVLSMLDELHVSWPQRGAVSPQALTSEQLSWVADSHLSALVSLVPEFGRILPERVPRAAIALARRCLDRLLAVKELPPQDAIHLDWALKQLEAGPLSFRLDIDKALSPFLAEAALAGNPAVTAPIAVNATTVLSASSSGGAIVAFQRDLKPKTTYRKIEFGRFQSANDHEASSIRSELQRRLGRQNVTNKEVVDELVRLKGACLSASDRDGKWYSSIEQQVKRSRSLERAHHLFSKCFPKGAPEPFDADAERIARERLKADGIPHLAIDTLIKRMKKLLQS